MSGSADYSCETLIYFIGSAAFPVSAVLRQSPIPQLCPKLSCSAFIWPIQTRDLSCEAFIGAVDSKDLSCSTTIRDWYLEDLSCSVVIRHNSHWLRFDDDLQGEFADVIEEDYGSVRVGWVRNVTSPKASGQNALEVKIVPGTKYRVKVRHRMGV